MIRHLPIAQIMGSNSIKTQLLEVKLLRGLFELSSQIYTHRLAEKIKYHQ